MDNTLKIFIVSAECVPFAKTGGLGDVVGSLPTYLTKLGHDVKVVIPFYSFIDSKKHQIRPFIKNMKVRMAYEELSCSVYQSTLKGITPVYLIEYEPFFGRPNIYFDSFNIDYPDNPMRFSFFSKAALQLCHELNFKPDIVHANDWHTAIVPAYLKRLYANDPLLGDAASVLTIHNMAYQGVYSSYFYNYTGLGWEDYTSEKFECLSAINFLKGGIYFADVVNTVSKGYAWETKTPSGGFGLDPFLIRKGTNYVGILNGADYMTWNSDADTLIPANYTADDLGGKAVCKEAMQKSLGLDVSSTTPVICIISRFVDQKGHYLLQGCIERIVSTMDVQFAILGTGDIPLEAYYSSLPQKFPGKIGAYIGYTEAMAHLIEAGSDFILMPSLFEPCGLNQIYSLKYGTLPIVRATGGLNDTIDNYNEATVEGTGFKFWEPSAHAICNTVKWALETYQHRKPHIKILIKRAMGKDYSWEKSATSYINLYKRAVENKRWEQQLDSF